MSRLYGRKFIHYAYKAFKEVDQEYIYKKGMCVFVHWEKISRQITRTLSQNYHAVYRPQTAFYKPIRFEI